MPIESLFLFALGLTFIGYAVFEYRSEFKGLYSKLFGKVRSDVEGLKTQQTFILKTSQWKDDPRWVLCCRFAFWGSFFSFSGSLVFALLGYVYATIGVVIPRHLLVEFLILPYSLFGLSLVLRVPLFIYERGKMREWLARELEKMPRETLLAIAQKESISVGEDEDSKAIISRLMEKLKSRAIEDYVFSEGEEPELGVSEKPETIKRWEQLYEELLCSYTQFYGTGGRHALENSVSSLMKRSLNREEAIRKLAEKEGLISKE